MATLRLKPSVFTETRAKKIQEWTRFCEKHVCFEIAALSPSPIRQGKKGGNFISSMRFKETNSFLYCRSSKKIIFFEN